MTQRYRILVVDDEKPIIESYRTILAPKAGKSALASLEEELFDDAPQAPIPGPQPLFDLDYALQGQEAVQKVRMADQGGSPYAVIFMDARMPPGIDGITAAQSIREIDPHVIIVLVTGYSDVDLTGVIGDRLPALRFLYLAKPFHPREIIQLATALSLQWDADRAHRKELEGKNEALNRLLDEEVWLRKASESAQRARIALFATVGHELKTPLNAVIGFSEVMLSGIAGPIGNTTYEGYVKEIHSAGRSLLHAISAILEVAEVESGKVRADRLELDLGESLDAAIAQTRDYAASRNIAIIFSRRDAKTLQWMGDSSHLQRALECLLHNAVKFSQPDGKVWVSLLDKAERYEIRIADKGRGMETDEVQTLMQPFAQADNQLSRNHEGLGLGLGLAKGLLELQGACMMIQSSRGQGTEVVIHFPREASPSARECA